LISRSFRFRLLYLLPSSRFSLCSHFRCAPKSAEFPSPGSLLLLFPFSLPFPYWFIFFPTASFSETRFQQPTIPPSNRIPRALGTSHLAVSTLDEVSGMCVRDRDTYYFRADPSRRSLSSFFLSRRTPHGFGLITGLSLEKNASHMARSTPGYLMKQLPKDTWAVGFSM